MLQLNRTSHNVVLLSSCGFVKGFGISIPPSRVGSSLIAADAQQFPLSWQWRAFLLVALFLQHPYLAVLTCLL